MHASFRLALPMLAASILSFGGSAVFAAPAEVVEQTSSFGALSLPYTKGFAASLSPMSGAYTSSDYFLSDYGFSISEKGSFSSALVSFNLENILSLSDVTLTLLSGTPWTTVAPTELTTTQISSRNSRTVETGWGSGSTQTLNQMQLGVGDYTIEVRGRVTGAAGGSYGGVLNVANVSAVPEPAGIVLALAGLALVTTATRRRNR